MAALTTRRHFLRYSKQPLNAALEQNWQKFKGGVEGLANIACRYEIGWSDRRDANAQIVLPHLERSTTCWYLATLVVLRNAILRCAEIQSVEKVLRMIVRWNATFICLNDMWRALWNRPFSLALCGRNGGLSKSVHSAVWRFRLSLATFPTLMSVTEFIHISI